MFSNPALSASWYSRAKNLTKHDGHTKYDKQDERNERNRRRTVEYVEPKKRAAQIKNALNFKILPRPRP